MINLNRGSIVNTQLKRQIMKFVKYFFIVIGILFLSLVAVGIFKTDYQSQASVEIDAPKQQVFAVYNNPLLYKRWMSNFQAIEQLEGEPNTIGNKHRLTFNTQTGEVTTLDQTLTEIKSGELITYNYENQWLEGTNKATFTSDTQGKTTIELTLDYSGRGIVQNALLFLMGSSIDKGHQQNLEKLKTLIEQSKPEELHDNGDEF